MGPQQAAAVSDVEVARYILTEIGNGKKQWKQALQKVAKAGLKLSPLGPLVAVEVEAEGPDSIWEKIKGIFSKKQ